MGEFPHCIYFDEWKFKLELTFTKEFRKRFKAIEFAVYCRGADAENYETFKEVFG